MTGRRAWVFVAALALTACGGPSSPGDTVRSWFHALQQGDMKAVLALTATPPGAPVGWRAQTEAEIPDELPEEMEEFLEELRGIRIEILSEEVHGGQPVRASVVARITQDGEPEVETFQLVMEEGRFRLVDPEGWR